LTQVRTGLFKIAMLALTLLGSSGCTLISTLGTDEHGLQYGKTWFIGGAGSIGNVVGTFDVPKGLRAAKYRGAIEVFAWQAVLGGTLRDQLDRERSEGEARRLAKDIEEYMKRFPGRRVNIIALSAGTGIAVWTLEALPRRCQVGTVVFLGSSLSREYDLSTALTRIAGHLHCFHSTGDPLLRFGLPLTGSVDRDGSSSGAAGLYGFAVPPKASAATKQLYAERLRDYPYQSDYAKYGYWGLHADSTAPSFIEHVVAPLLNEPLDGSEPPPANRPSAEPSASRPAAECTGVPQEQYSIQARFSWRFVA
jgi:pimeloyl-ACP methyl ester carboxylesterase